MINQTPVFTIKVYKMENGEYVSVLHNDKIFTPPLIPREDKLGHYSLVAAQTPADSVGWLLKLLTATKKAVNDLVDSNEKKDLIELLQTFYPFSEESLKA